MKCNRCGRQNEIVNQCGCDPANMPTRPLETPWGPAQSIMRMGDRGILSVSTASHGGVFVPPDLYAKMPEALRCNVYGGTTWFEEDAEWALVALAFPELFERSALHQAMLTIEFYRGQEPYAKAAAWLAANINRFAEPMGV